MTKDLQRELVDFEGGQSLSFVKLGNYGWAHKPDFIYKIGDPGWFFQDFFLLHFGLYKVDSKSEPSVFQAGLPESIELGEIRWSCRLIDNTVALLVQEMEIKNCSEFIKFAVKKKTEPYNRFMESWSQEALSQKNSSVLQSISKLIEWCKDELVKRISEEFKLKLKREQALLLPQTDRSDVKDSECLIEANHSGFFGSSKRFQHLFTEKHPIYSDCFTRFWTHPFYSFTESEWSEVTKAGHKHLSELLTNDIIDNLEEKVTIYGNGRSARIIPEESSWQETDQLIDALCVMQYFYSCFEIADTILPVYIAHSHAKSIRGKHQDILESLRQTRNAINIIINDYNDLRTRTGEHAYIAMKKYHDSWRMAEMTANLSKKLTFLEEMMSASSDAIDKRTESTIQRILFAITLLSVLGLLASLHEYLVGDYEARFLDPLHQVALGIGKGDVIIYSLLIILASLLIYYIWRRWHR